MSDQVLSQEEVDALFLTMKTEGNEIDMSEKYESIIAGIKKIGEDIDTIGLNDLDSWKKLGDDLGAIIGEIPEKFEKVKPLLASCSEGLRAMSGGSVSDALSLLDAIYEGVEVAARCFSDIPDQDELIETAVASMESILYGGEDAFKQGEEDAHGEYDQSIAMLHDAAALLVEIELEDYEGLEELQKLLLEAIENGLPATSMESTEHTIEKINEIIESGSFDSDEVPEKIGRLIEDAINEASDAENMVLTESADKSEMHPRFEDNSGAESIIDEFGPAEETDENLEVPGLIENPNARKAGEIPAICLDDRETNYMPDDFEPELLSAFITESSELITNAEEALLTLETDPEDMEAIGSVFRAFHTIKGTAAFLDLTPISEMGHHAESLLSRVRDGEIRYSGGYADLSLKTLDMLKELIMGVQEALDGKPLLRPDGYDDLMRILINPEASGILEENDEDLKPPRNKLGEILVAQGKLERSDVEEALSKKEEKYIGEELVQSKAASLSDVAHALRTQQRMDPKPKKKQMIESTIRVPTERLDRFIDTVGELVVAHSMVAQDELVSDGAHHELYKKVNHTSKIVRELQDMSMSMRMIPLKSTFRKMARLVRDLSRKVGKNVKFETEGEDTEIDRNMVDIVNDPLVHMIRNAIDHGIEFPDERLAAGKEPFGTVRISAYHAAGSVFVEITDDGNGLDRDAILAKGIERGLVTDAFSMTDKEVFGLIFEPGFSTAGIVSEVSGRGVGMDVVKRNIENLRGQVEIDSTPGKGSRFKISLPLTMAIIDGMVVRVGRQRYVIPTVSIVRSVRPSEENIKTVLRKGEMVQLQNDLIPLFRLAELFEIEEAETDPTKALVVIVENHSKKVGLLIDELIGSQQIVIKNLGEAMGDILGISGSAIMPNGRVGLILDVGGIVRIANSVDDAGVLS